MSVTFSIARSSLVIGASSGLAILPDLEASRLPERSSGHSFPENRRFPGSRNRLVGRNDGCLGDDAGRVRLPGRPIQKFLALTLN